MLQAHGLTNMRLAETEKYPHVTYFFNGGIETPFTGEDRVLLPSPKVPTYDLQPEMSAAGVADAFVDSVSQHKHDVIICNFANPDMVGHTGVLAAAIAAIKAVDACLGRASTPCSPPAAPPSSPPITATPSRCGTTSSTPRTPPTPPTWCR